METIGVTELLEGKGSDIQLRVTEKSGEQFVIKTTHTMSEDQLKWLKAGSALNHIRSQKAGQ